MIITLHTEISKVAPIIGISIGVPEDKTTWRIDFTEEATSSQRMAAKLIVDSFDPILEQEIFDKKTLAINALIQQEKENILAKALTDKNILPEVQDYKATLEKKNASDSIQR